MLCRVCCLVFATVCFVQSAPTQKPAQKKRVFIASSPIFILRNTSLNCEEAQRRYKKVTLSTNDKMDLFQSIGGQYVSQYMATDDESAASNFKNVLDMSKKFLNDVPKGKFDAYEDNLKTKYELLHHIKDFFEKSGESLTPEEFQQVAKGPLSAAARRRHLATGLSYLNLFLKLKQNTHKSQNSIHRTKHQNDEKGDIAKTQQRWRRELAPQATFLSEELSGPASGTAASPSSSTSSGTTIYPQALPQNSQGQQRVLMGADGSKTVIDFCTDRGTQSQDGYLNMCTVCRATTTLPSNLFPRIINEAICSVDDRNCFIAKGTAHGQCKQAVFYLNILKKKPGVCKLALQGSQYVLVDEWALETQPIRVSCECAIDRRSIFAKFVKGEP